MQWASGIQRALDSQRCTDLLRLSFDSYRQSFQARRDGSGRGVAWFYWRYRELKTMARDALAASWA